MRKIPPHITDASVQATLLKIDQEIDAKMKVVNTLRDKIKKTGPNSVELDLLKKMGNEIDQLDQEWKRLLGLD